MIIKNWAKAAGIVIACCGLLLILAAWTVWTLLQILTGRHRPAS